MDSRKGVAVLWLADQIHQNHVHTPHLWPLAVHRGLRQGELLGLRWEDVDLETGKLQVRRTLSLTRQGHVFEPPKNGKGRCVELTEDTSGALKRHLTDQLEEIEALGDVYQDQGLIFPGDKGQPMRPWTLTRKLERIMERAGLPTSASTISGTLAPRSYSRRVCTPSSFRSC